MASNKLYIENTLPRDECPDRGGPPMSVESMSLVVRWM
jgi:hypothetical protein